MGNDITEEALLKEGFKKNEWTDEGETFTEYVKSKGDVKIEISGLSLVELSIETSYTTVPNCTTMDDVRALVKLFNL